ncbi:MAG: rhodanese-like domain-containing protein [Thiohalobacterales bacterium]|nr:rhodanese-like domain-containing protein [Thiohalobacterales bacterium]
MDIGQLTEFAGNHPLLVFALFAILAMLIGGELKQRLSGINEVAPAQAVRMLNHENAVMIDMRSDKEYGEGHIVNAVHLPDASGAKPDKFRDRSVIVYCRSGSRSQAYCSKLRKQGFESVYNLKGGVLAWERAELPLTKAD